MPTPAASVPPSIRLRTALMITLTGWLAAKSCSQPGIESMGTNALDTNVGGTTASVAMAWAACALPATRPRLMKTQVKA
jgi:hypothetical protein